ncbi:MAG: hypothetical protein IPI45_11940 [Saprospiraceae bacterium]|nr:hypothetical protein [Saprospiraceae bacterium]MBK7738474.1 hypothetical protein [Saprospiraceae bacterium]MBK7912954.1 hypothetical protein [Saprospiraceae bacterium]
MTNPIDLNYSTYWQRLRYYFSIAPVELKVFFVFSIIAVLTYFIAIFFLSSIIGESIKPLVGNGIINLYLLAIGFIAESMAGKSFLHPNLRSNYTLIIFLLIYTTFKIYDFVTWNGEDFGNPSIINNEWQLVWTILIPGFWILVMLSPRIKKYYHNLRLDYEKL